MFQLIPKWMKVPVYRLICRLTRCRLCFLPLTLQQAEWWAETIKRYPVVFQGDSFAQLQTLPCGVQMRLGITDHIERQLRVEGEWDRPVSAVLRAVLTPGSTLLDIGANIGYFSLLGSKLVGSTGTVVSIEPSVRALRKFAENVHLNHCGNVLLLSVGAGAAFQRLRLTLATENNIGGSSILPDAGALPTETIAVIPLGTVLNSLNIVPDLIKIDVEGFELFALQGVLSELAATPPVVCEVTAEFLQRNGQSVRELFAFMTSLHYNVYQLLDHEGTISGNPLDAHGSYETSAQFDAMFVHASRQFPLPVIAPQPVPTA